MGIQATWSLFQAHTVIVYKITTAFLCSMEKSRRRITNAISSFCDSEEHVAFDGATKPQSALQRVNHLVSEVRSRVPAYAKCRAEAGEEAAPGTFAFSLSMFWDTVFG